MRKWAEFRNFIFFIIALFNLFQMKNFLWRNRNVKFNEEDYRIVQAKLTLSSYVDSMNSEGTATFRDDSGTQICVYIYIFYRKHPRLGCLCETRPIIPVAEAEAEAFEIYLFGKN